ncbi:hypothetical protein QN345_05215, partial [Cryobacterium sp. 10I1]|nr:hypothetical protein [Cryobacterium sp. 10I1]
QGRGQLRATRQRVQPQPESSGHVRPGHTETGLADHPISGVAPNFPAGLQPEAVAARIVGAIAAGERDLPSSAFAPPA